VSRKRPLLFKSELDSRNQNSFKAIKKSFLSIIENIIGFKIQFKFDFDSKPYFEKELQKYLFLKSL
jgi:hypothetical protein